eukprot:3983502-Alexandrium_andersonii.AAC.1
MPCLRSLQRWPSCSAARACTTRFRRSELELRRAPKECILRHICAQSPLATARSAPGGREVPKKAR